MLAAEWSGKGAIKDQQDIFLTAEIVQADHVAAVVSKAELWGDLIEGYSCHLNSPESD
jgi:hypothetical protein